MKALTLGGLNSSDDRNQALRDIESHFNQMLSDSAPADTPEVVMRDTEGNLRQYSLVAGGGCTITIDEDARTITISVP